MNREAIYEALFALASLGEGLGGRIAWTPPNVGDPTTFAYTSRRVKLWDDLPAQPALCQAEHDEQVRWTNNQPPITTLSASWMIYLNEGKDPAAVPAQTTNAVLDVVTSLFVTNTPEGVQDLGLNVAADAWVYRCWIEGRIQKFQGDLDGQTLIIVPIKILVP